MQVHALFVGAIATIAAVHAAATPAALEVYHLDNDITAVGAANRGLDVRDLTKKCSGKGYNFGSLCSPGGCDCAGNNGCWKYGGQNNFICQCGPGANRGAFQNCE